MQYAKSEEDIRRCFAAIQCLRPHLTIEAAVAQVLRQQTEQGYHLAYLEAEDGQVCSIAGFRFAEFLAWGRVLYIDDLVTLGEYRGQGHAGKLLKDVISLAAEKGCDAVHLDSGYQRHDAHRLYLNHGFHIATHHFIRLIERSPAL